MPEFFNVDFSGRASRAVFWKNQLASLLILLLAFIPALVAAGAQKGLATVSFGLFALAVTIYVVASAYSVSTRRCRDLGHSGWMVLLFLVPLVGLFFFFYLGFAKGQTAVDEGNDA